MVKKSKKPIAHKAPLWKTIFKVQYKPALGFYERLFPAAQKFVEYPDWRTDGLRVVLHDFVKHCSLGIGLKSSTYDQDTDNVEAQETYIENILTRLPRDLDIPSFTRIGFRRQYLFQSSLKYDELVAILNVKLLSQEESLRKFLPSEAKDLTYHVNFADGDLQIHVTIGPMKKEDIPRYIQLNKEVHFDPKRDREDYLQVISAYPDVAVFYDIDIWPEEENLPTSDALPFAKDAPIRIEKMIEEFQNYFFAKKVHD